MAGKPRTPADQVNLARTRSRRPRELAERAAAAQLAATAAAQAAGARVFTLYGQAPVVVGPGAPEPEQDSVAEVEGADGGTALAFYRRLLGGR